MAIVLEFEGTDDYLSLLEPFNLSDGEFIDFEVIQGAINSGFEMWAGTWETGTTAGQWYFGKLNSSNGMLTLFNRNTSTRNNSVAGVLVEGEQATFTVERNLDTLRVLKNGVQVIAPLSFASGDLDISNVKVFFAGNEGNTSFCFTGQTVSIAVDTRYNFDINGSVHTAGTPLVTETVSAKTATGVNMPTAALGQPGSAWIDLGGGGVTVTPSTINSASVSNNPAITFNSVVSLTPNTIDSLSVANNPSIQFGSVLNISPATIDSASVSNDPILSFSAVLNITPQAIDSVSAANNPSIIFNSVLNLTPSTIDSLSVSNNPVIEFKSVINVLPQTIDSLSVSKNPFISFGVVQTIGNVTASFKDSGISVKYEEDEINVGYKPNAITVNFK